MKKNVLLVVLFVVAISGAFFLGISRQTGVSTEKYQKVVEQNKLLKEQLNQINTILLEKDKEYIDLTKQLLTLDKELAKQQLAKEQIVEELSELAKENPTASNNSVDLVLVDDIQEENLLDGDITHIELQDEIAELPVSSNENKLTYVDDSEQLFLNPKRKMPPSVFRTASDVTIVDDQYRIQEVWKQGTSFTAREKYGEYYKISGYFVDKKWTGAKRLLLIPIENSIRR